MGDLQVGTNERWLHRAAENWIALDQFTLKFAHGGRVDAIIVGAGTVVGDNPMLTVRGETIRRTPIRVVIDPTLRTSPDSNIFNDEAPTLIVHAEGGDASGYSASTLELPPDGDALDLAPMLRHLVREYDATNVIVEGGATTFKHFFNQRLANELWIFAATHEATHTPKLNMNHLIENLSLRLMDERFRGGVTVLRYRITPCPQTT